MIHAMSIVMKGLLDVMDSQVHGRSLYGSDDLGFDLGGLSIELQIFNGLAPELHGGGKKGGHDTDKRFYFRGIWEVFLQIFHFAQQMGVTVLEGTRGFVVSGITVHHQNAGQGFFSKDHLRDFGRAGVTEEKEADLVRGKEPDVAILAVGSPPLLLINFKCGKLSSLAF